MFSVVDAPVDKIIYHKFEIMGPVKEAMILLGVWIGTGAMEMLHAIYSSLPQKRVNKPKILGGVFHWRIHNSLAKRYFLPPPKLHQRI